MPVDQLRDYSLTFRGCTRAERLQRIGDASQRRHHDDDADTFGTARRGKLLDRPPAVGSRHARAAELQHHPGRIGGERRSGGSSHGRMEGEGARPRGQGRQVLRAIWQNAIALPMPQTLPTCALGALHSA